MKKLITILLSALMGITAYTTTFAQVTNGLVADYPFNGNANDATANGNNGTPVNGAVLTTDRFGNINSAYAFNHAIGQAIIVPGANLNLSSELSFSLWFLQSSINSSGRGYRLLQKFIPGFSNGYGLDTYGGAGENQLRVLINTNLSSTVVHSLNTWHHAVVTYKNKTINLYLDNVLVGTSIGTNDITLSTQDLYLGGDPSTVAENLALNGKIDDVKIYNRMLERCEINLLAGVANTPLVVPTFVNMPTPTVCAGSSVNYSVNPVANATSYEWTIDNVIVNTNSVPTYSKTWVIADAGNHIVSVKARNACGSSGNLTTTFNVIVTPSSPTQIISEATYCYNSKANILTSPIAGATSYEWKVNSATRLETGLYIGADFSAANSGFIVGSNNISIAALNGTCKSAPYIASVTLNSVPTGVTIDGPTSICPYTYANYSVSPGNAQLGYFWKINSSDPTVNYQNNANALRVNFPYSPGNSYDIKVTVSNSCGNTEITKTVTLNSNVPPIPIISCSTKVSGVCQLLKTTSNQYATQTKWYIDGVYKPALDGSITLDLTNVAYQGVQYEVWESNGTCSYPGYFGECQNVVQGQSTRMAAEEIASPQSTVTVYPNPNSGSFIIETDGAAGTAYIINTSGELVETVTLEKGVSVTSVKLSSAGLYVVKVKTESANKSFKVSVE